MPVLLDDEFGRITVRRSTRSTHVRIRVAPDGSLRASLPLYAPLLLVKRLIKTSREEIRLLLHEHHGDTHYENGMQIGKSHTLVVRHVTTGRLTATRHAQQIVVTLPAQSTLGDVEVKNKIRDVVIAALRIEAKSYLPKRLQYLATKYDFTYERVRFSHAGSRWGSCSSNGTISLNIALMKLPFELIDYVLIHELSHTVEMNHSQNFWHLVASGDPDYKLHRKILKNETPSM